MRVEWVSSTRGLRVQRQEIRRTFSPRLCAVAAGGEGHQQGGADGHGAGEQRAQAGRDLYRPDERRGVSSRQGCKSMGASMPPAEER